MKRLPRIERMNDGFSFLLDEKPFVMLAAEVHNSACTSREYMKKVWKKVTELNCNTILAPVYWELIEPQENHFDFDMVEELITDAREQNIKLVLLWFGSWKNGCSTYAPGWVKTDCRRFPRVENEYGLKTKILSMFQSEILSVESKAFTSFVKFIKDFDSSIQTVLAIQVENEVGVLGAARDFSVGAEEKYKEKVPAKLLNYLKDSKNHAGRIAKNFESDTDESWSKVFQGYAEEAFMGWYYSLYIDQLAKSGKEKYSLPMFTNAWLKEFDDESPGSFPCGGPLPEVLNIWKCGAPNLDVLSPDIYTFHFRKIADLYTRSDNPLFIPETRRDKWAVANLYLAIGTYHTLCYSPFGAESIGENKSFITQRIHTDSNDKNVSDETVKDYLSQSYQMLENMMPIITTYYGTTQMLGFAQSEGYMTNYIRLGNFQITIEYYHQMNDEDEYIPGAGIVILEDEYKLIFIGYGYRAYLCTTNQKKQLDFLSLEKGTYDQESRWVRYMVLNGDEQHIQMEEKPTILKASYYEI